MEQGELAHSTVMPKGQGVQAQPGGIALDDAATKLLTSSSAVWALIEAHQAARVGLDAAAKATDGVVMRRDGIVASPEDTVRREQAWDAASDAEQAASDAIVRHRPSNTTEAAILLRYLADEPNAIDPDEMGTVLRNVAEAMSRPTVARPTSSSLATVAPSLPTLAGLAEACDWATKHVNWINAVYEGDDWDDSRYEAEIAKHSTIWERAIAEPATSFSDLAAKARLFGEDWERHTPDDGTRDGLDRMVASVLRDVAVLDAARPALLDKIIAGWAEWTKTRGEDESPQAVAAWERTAALRNDLIRSAVALPATIENVPAKALALAWLEYVDLWFQNKLRDDYANDGKLALDIHEAVQNASSLTFSAASGPIAAAPAFDIAGMNIRQLEGLHDVAQFVRELCSAVACQPRCSNEQLGMQPAGEFVEWIAQACDRLADNIHAEALRRPDSASDPRLTRLSILARFIVENDDADLRTVFARDLSAVA